MSSANLVAVVIPVYQAELTDHERISLTQCVRILGHYPLILVKPEHLDATIFLALHPSFQVFSFDNTYFSDVAGYNRLMVSEGFYRAFESYEYILIHQLDAFVFSDRLREWCERGYDYIGAPHVTPPVKPTGSGLRRRFKLRKVLLNGGLSLRRVSACRRFLWVFGRFFGTWRGNEDGLFSLHFPRLYPGLMLLNLPSWEAALPFAFEQHPAQCFQLNQGQLPLGCHAWERYDPDFWRPFFREQGYRI
ncbi:MAG: hypothetical protein LH606_07765 [Cytophagaceae bacterium]|nr:hypothetical protein [Cytophagaceae bacterium]